MQLSFTNKKEEFKKLEQFLKIKHITGETVTIGHTCTEIDKQMPELLGVSRAVLENVVLCHQEESLWPFSDNMTLKKVFDELFDTARIAKFSEQINGGLKDKKKVLRDERMTMELAKREYDRYIGLMAEFGVSLGKVVDLRSEIDVLEARLAQDQDLVSFTELQRNIGSCDIRLEQFNSQLKSVEVQISGFKDWTVDLVTPIVFQSNFEDQVINHPDDLLSLIESRIIDGDLFTALDADLGIPNLENTINSFNDQKVSVLDIEPNPMKRSKEDEYISRAIELLDVVIGRTKELTSGISKELAIATENLRANDTKLLVQEVKFLAENLLDKKIEDYELTNETFLVGLMQNLEDLKIVVENKYQQALLALGKVNENHSNEATRLKQRHKALEAKLNEFKLKETIQEQKILQAKLKSEQEGLEANKRKKELVFQECMESSDQISAIRREIHLVRKTLVNRKFREHDWQRERIFRKLEFENIEPKTNAEVSIVIAEAESLLRNADERKAEIKAAIGLETNNKKKRELLCEQLSRRLEDFKLKFKRFNLKLEYAQPYDSYKALKEKLSDQRTKVTLLRYSLDEFLPKTLKDSLRTGRCFLCDRSLHTENISNLERNLQSRIDRAKKNVLESEDELQNDHARFEQLQQHSKDIKEFQKCSDQFKENSSEMDSASLRICDLVYEQKKIVEEARVLNERLADLRDLQNTMILLESLDQADIETEFVCEPERDQAELTRLQSEEVALSRKTNNNQTVLRELEQKITSSQDRITFLSQQLAFVKGDDIIRTEVLDDTSTFSTREEVNSALTLCKVDIEELPIRTEQNKLKLTAEKENTDKKLSSVKSCIEKAQSVRQILLNNPFPQIKKKLEAQLIEVMKSDEVLRKFRNFLELYTEKKTLSNELVLLIEERRNLEIGEQKLQSKKKLFEELSKKLNEKKGQDSMLQTALDETFNKLEKLQTTEAVYAQKLAQCEYSRLLIDDLELVHRSLENALVEFHTHKIAEINKIIHNIWKTSYAGPDIETIKILSECTSLEEAQLNRAGANKKNYEYKVVFYNKEHKQLAMKGRSSAGQRMLASIVIRLALSEAFCINSGLLALDEPTTNLDEDNVRLLAGFLKKLIKAREKQKSFQLIIITHDKEFINMIGSHLEYFYLVSKDQKGFSKIEKVPFEQEGVCLH
jgi:DNA repair protein RAD50